MCDTDYIVLTTPLHAQMQMPRVFSAVKGNKAQAFIKAYEADKPADDKDGGPVWQALQQEWGYMRMGVSVR